MAKKIVIYGGSFNPPHIGHVQLVGRVLSQWDCDKVYIIPCHQHAFNKELAPFYHRMQMVLNAFSVFDKDKVLIDGSECVHKTTYMIDTVKRVMKEENTDDITLAMGMDAADDFDKWKDAWKLKAMCKTLVFGRGEYSNIANVSSTEIRKWFLENGEQHVGDFDCLILNNGLPIDVFRYIIKNRLYFPPKWIENASR